MILCLSLALVVMSLVALGLARSLVVRRLLVILKFDS